MFLIFMFVVRPNGRACAFRDTTARLRSKKRRGIEVQNMAQSTTQTFGVLSQGVLIESSDKVVRLSEARCACETGPWELEQQFEVKAAKVREEYLAAVLESTPSRRTETNMLVTSFASAISYGKFVRGAGWWSGSGRALGGLRGRNDRVKAPDRGRIQIRGVWWIAGGGPATMQQASSRAVENPAIASHRFRALKIPPGRHGMSLAGQRGGLDEPRSHKPGRPRSASPGV
jgi:hypothetical protein